MELMQHFSAWELVLWAICALLVGMSKAGIKGIGLVIVPVMATLFGARPSTGIVLPMLITADIMAVIYYRRSVRWVYIRKLLPWALAGVLGGMVVGDLINEAQFRLLLAAIIVGMLALLIYNDVRKRKNIPDNHAFAGFMGLTGGFTTMVGNAAGPVFSIYLLAMRLPKNVFIGTGAWFFFIINLSKVPLHVFAWETIHARSLMVDLLAVPLIVAGMFAGIRLVKLFPEKVYRYFVIVMTLLGAAIMIFS